MKKQYIVLEISHQFVKILVCNVIDGKPVVNYVKKVPTFYLLDNGMICDKAGLVNVLTKLNPLMDDEYKINLMLNDVILVLPPYGVEMYENQTLTTVFSDGQMIEKNDIKNFYSMIRNKKLPVDNELINIIVDAFKLDDGKYYKEPPLGKVSYQFIGFTRVYTLPKKISISYGGVVSASGIKVSNQVVSSLASTELLNSDENIPEDFVLVDIGASTTSVSVISGKRTVDTRSFSWGSHNITVKIMERFNVNEKEAEKIKVLYGLDTRIKKFVYPVLTKETEAGQIIYDTDSLNDLVVEELEKLIFNLNAAFDQLNKAHENQIDFKELPMYLIGGGAKLIGLVPYLKENYEKENIELYVPRVIGARDPSLVNVLGAALIKDRYLSELSEMRSTVTPITREE